MTTAAPGANVEYLDRANDAGLLHELSGRPIVAGQYHDAVGGEQQCMVEYCHPDLLSGGGEQLAVAMRARFPEADSLVVRTAADVALPAPWLAHLTYVRFAGAPARSSSAPSPVTILAAGPEHDESIMRWLVQAFETYGAEQQHRGGGDELLAAARGVLAAPDRRSLVAAVEGRAIGHVTLLCEAYDDVAIGRHVELLDVLVDADPPLRKAAVEALTSAAAAHARQLGLPLIGHVVHPTAAPSRGEAIVRSLVGRGWTVDHRYWRRRYGVEVAPDAP